MIPSVIGLPWIRDNDRLDYGNGTLTLQFSGSPAPSPNYDVLTCTAYRIPPGTPPPPQYYGSHIDKLPARVLFDTAGGGKPCGSDICPTGPPKAVTDPDVPTTAMKLSVKKAPNISFEEKLMRIEGPALGPVYQLSNDESLATLISELEQLIGPQATPRIFHLYRVLDDRGPVPVHPFHNKILAIPATDELLIPLPPLPEAPPDLERPQASDDGAVRWPKD